MSSSKTAAKSAAPAEHGYEFFGPPGAFGISFGLPILVYVFTFVCNDISGCPAPSLLSPRSLSLEQLKIEVGWPQNGIWGLASWEATGAVLAYYLLNLILYRVLPATETDGTVLSSGGRLKYRFNTFYSNTVTLAALAAGTVAQGAEFPVWVFISENYLQILTANIGIAYAIATFVYVRSFSVKPGNKEFRELAAGGHTGNLLYDWFIGRELNPRVTIPLIGEVDLKEWCELRPGMMGWIILNCSWCAQQYRNFGFVTDSIICITIVQALYIIDSWWFEPAILTTMDITTDGFGMMLAFGDLVWVPFIYSMQTRYLSVHPLSLGPAGLAGTLSLIGLGFYIFRSANSQKNTFRTNPSDPSVAHLEYIETKTGSKLLISGWWGIARHINYLGDWIQSWPYSLPTGLAGYQILAAGAGAAGAAGQGAYIMKDGREVIQGNARGWAIPITYFYIVYFAVLLIHRERRDDEKCHRKYGEDWDKYKKIVRWRIIPGIY
ncbi:Delta(14)-sterol reductase [Metarhizium acridum]|uniref:Delta(14)-sterol reductase n=1 Tax=Metarhizium acridum (strain CQMa 102) TaxID=655827 RepID=E9EF80_METAQ|nr:C-14 sterol reductase [Metarhizium acridum CQMa 102]EFY85396.1 C-14 sterol reductase [Metarhizium acridum CQMa 102]KAG8426777.1 Delta(14)-sterol reductase [Metarhizium acridum]